MGYKSIVKSSARKAFAMAKDLVDLVTLTQKNNTVYNFDTNLPTSTSPVSKTIKGLLMEKGRTHAGNVEMGSSKAMQMLFLAEDLDDPDIYDTITMSNGDVWTIVPPSKSDGYIITADVMRNA
jgi:hypothetical protein